METEEGNKLIFDFMDGIHSKHGDIDFWEMKNLKYHSSWDWLMPVIDKIESVEGCSYKVGLEFAFAYISDTSQHRDPYVVRATGKNRIDTAYNMVIKFIQRYSNNSLK